MSGPIRTLAEMCEAAADIAHQASYSNSYYVSKCAADIATRIRALAERIEPKEPSNG